MNGFFKKLFGSKNKGGNSELEALVVEALEGVIEKGGFDLTYSLDFEEAEGNMFIELMGEDEELIKEKKGQVLDAIQLYLKRVVQHNFPEDRTNISVDCGGYRNETEQALIERAENLKTIAIEQQRSVYYRALPPKERKIVHQYLAKDPRVKSRSLGDGLYKKIKIFPSKESVAEETAHSE